MTKFAITVAGAGALAAAAVGLAAAAAAAPPGGSADDTINNLKSQGYLVQINGATTAPLADCWVTNVDGLSNNDSAAGQNPTQTPTAYVDVACPTGC